MSNAKIGFAAAGAFTLATVAGAGGFYAGHLSAKVQFLERGQVSQQAAFQQPYVPYGMAPMPGGYEPSAAPTSAPVAPEPVGPQGLNAEGVPTQLAPVLSDPETVASLMSALSQATAFEAQGETSQEQPIYAFFDPRCPYCKRAMQELNGKARINWIPVSTLGDLQSGSDLIEGMRTLDVEAAVSSVAEGSIPAATGTEETQGQLQDNASILLALYEGALDVVAVPTFLVPRADGTAMFYRGFNDGDGAKLIEAYGS